MLALSPLHQSDEAGSIGVTGDGFCVSQGKQDEEKGRYGGREVQSAARFITALNATATRQ